MKNFCTFAVCAMLVVSVVGCSSESAPVVQVSAPAIADDIVLPNTHCPVMGGEIDEATSVEWGDQKVYFCCPPCVDEWNEMTDEERNAKLREIQSEDHDGEEHADHEGHGDHDEDGEGHAEHDGEHEEGHGGDEQSDDETETSEVSSSDESAEGEGSE